MAGHFLIVEATFYAKIVEAQASGAIAVLEAASATYERVVVPGALEIPAAIAMASNDTCPFDGFIALGCVIRGETPHFDYVCQETTRGLGEVALRANIPVGYGLLTTDDLAQAEQRSHTEINSTLGQSNKGQDAADAVLEMIHTFS